MKFPIKFTRIKPSTTGFITLGSDALPVDSDGNPRPGNMLTDDNYISSRPSNINGWPLMRLAVACKYTGAGSPGSTNLPATVFFFESNLQCWVALASSNSHIIESSISTTTGPALQFYDVVPLIDLPHVTANLDSIDSGTVGQLLLVSDNSAPNGQYDFIMGYDITSKPF